MSKPPFLSVIIPSYNEQKNIARGVLDDMLSYLQSQSHEWELIFSDDGSTDGTLNVLEKFAQKSSHIRVIKNVHAGKGPTVQSGMLAATGQWRLFADFDQSTPLKEVELLYPYIQDFDVVIGSREIAGAKRNREPLHRHIMGKGFNVLVQLLAVPGIQDTQCGFKIFSAPATEKVFPRLYVYGKQPERQDAFTGAFDVEALFLARKMGFAIKEVPIFWQHNQTDRVSPIKDSLRMLRDILKIRLAGLQGKYKKSPA
jgi:glycosyltransferase involved in cell wall biosynthesis